MPENERHFFGVFIPQEVWRDRNLKSTEMMVYMEIYYLSLNRPCYASNAHLGEMIGISERQVSRWITSLRNKGYIRCQEADNRVGREMTSTRRYDFGNGIPMAQMARRQVVQDVAAMDGDVV